MKGKILFGLTLCSQLLFGQINDGGSQPRSLQGFELQTPTQLSPAAAGRWERNSDKHQLYKIGQVLPVAGNLRSIAQPTAVAGGQIWRLELRSPNAKGLNVYFKNFRLPNRATLHIYTPDYQEVIGGFGAHNNTADGHFATEPLAGDAIILEYFEPNDAAFEGVLELEGCGYFYEFRAAVGSERRDFGDSESCEVNVNCSEGNGRTAQRDAVARILVKVGSDLGWCTGTLINNVAQDCTPYFLTAMHCGLTGSNTLTTAADINQWIFYFNYQGSGCSDPVLEPLGRTLTGAVARANSNDAGGDTGSDFLLLELNSTPPSTYNAYYAGWRNTNTVPAGGYCIHHPAGDIKKISTFGNTVTSGAWGTAIGSHWEVDWVATTNGSGVTEGGSSGSPIFNNSHELVGTLTGGASSCQNLSGGDAYGKVSYHWGSNGLTSSRRLSDWLDPNSTGATSLAGSYTPCATGVERREQAIYSVYPNPNYNGTFTLEHSADATLRVYDALGRALATYRHQAPQSQFQLDQPAGVYFLEVETPQGRWTQKLVLQKP